MKALCLVCENTFEVDDSCKDCPLSYSDTGELHSVCPGCLLNACRGKHLIKMVPLVRRVIGVVRDWNEDQDETIKHPFTHEANEAKRCLEEAKIPEDWR